jgi:hypothetical protein
MKRGSMLMSMREWRNADRNSLEEPMEHEGRGAVGPSLKRAGWKEGPGGQASWQCSTLYMRFDPGVGRSLGKGF